MYIRTANLQDHELLASLGAQTFRETFASDNTPEDMSDYLAMAFSPDRQAAELADLGTTFLIAEPKARRSAARVSSWAAPTASRDSIRSDRALYSIAAWIGRGLVRPMQACSGRRRLGGDVIWLDVWERNLRAIEFYRARDSVGGTQAFVLGHDVQNDLLMQNRLSSASADR
jgi:hypothetical protein